ncbi:putative bifunctional diguanylate cyclase/phosphodiesterase [Lichenibacterium ramalinae]|nr:EAL domain-containing protein [Lichenibacterium ramalinae]
MASVSESSSAEDLTLQLQRLTKRLARERQARLKAEEIAEHGLRELYDKQEHLRLLERVATQANLSNSVEEAFRFTLKAVRTHCAAALANVFWLRSDEADLHPAGIWDTDDTQNFSDFLDAGKSLTFAPGIGLPGRVLQSRSAFWMDDVATDASFLRARAARDCGLHAGFAIPIVVGSDVVAVMEVFQLTIMKPNQVLLAVLTQIGVQLGRVFERSRSEAKLRHDATHDALTKLPNRRALIERMEEGFWPKRRFKLLLIDLDRFKAVNDTFGHPVGDLLLVQVADRLRAVVGQKGFVARLGGDELATLVEGDLDRALDVSHQITMSFNEPFDLGRATVRIGCSIGLCCTDDAASVMELVQLSDIALYEAKRNGGGQTSCYQVGMKEAVAERHSLESDMRIAMGRREFHLAYQPVMTLCDDRIIGYEALIRWDHPVRGLVPPASFIPVAEQSDQILAIGRWVLEEACREAATWIDDRHVAVNVSSVQLRSPRLLEHLISALTTSGLPADRLEIEVTETALIESGEKVSEILTAIRTLGVKVAMDDFGTGYSSLSHLRQLPFDRIKIDRSFVANAMTDQSSMAVLKGVIQIGRDLGVSTLAEGVETKGQLDLLRSLGCDVIQGYLIGKPTRIARQAMAAA